MVNLFCVKAPMTKHDRWVKREAARLAIVLNTNVWLFLASYHRIWVAYLENFTRERPSLFTFSVLNQCNRYSVKVGSFFLKGILKSVHFKKTVAQSSFLSKVFAFLLKSKQNQRKWQHFWKKCGLLNCLLKMNGQLS